MTQHKRRNPRPTDYVEYLRSDHWQKVRGKVLRRDGWRCVLCDERATQVHHRHYLGTSEERQRDLLSLCSPCHDWVHAKNIELPRVRKGSGNRGTSLRHVREVAQAAGHPKTNPVLAGEHTSRNAEAA